jgi:hypothetical protein
MPRKQQRQAPVIEQVQSRFQQWRKTRRGKAPIPDELWEAAAALARQDGVNRTATALGLDGSKLKRRLGESAAAAAATTRRTAPTAPPTFVELRAAPAANPVANRPEYTIELEGRHGKLRIHCPGATAAELAGLSRALLLGIAS